MKTHLLILLLSTVAAVTLPAQHDTIPYLTSPAQREAYYRYKNPKAASSRALHSRMIAIARDSVRTGVHSLLDSTTYSYSGTRGTITPSSVTPIPFDESYLYSHGYQSSALVTRAVQTFDAADRILSHIEQRYDAGTWINNYRSLYTYDGNGHLDTMSTWGWDTVAGWWEGDREAYSYSTTGRLLSYYYISTYQGVTQPMNGDVYTYDSADSLASETHYQWDGASQLLPQVRRHYRYSTAGDRVYQDRETWSAGAWVPLEADSITYTVAHQQLGFYEGSYVSGAWYYAGCVYNHYGAGGRLDSVDFLTLTGSAWLLTSRTYYEYNAAGKLAVLTIPPDSNGGYRYLFSYTADGSLSTHITQGWDVDHWEDFDRDSFAYDAAGYMALHQYAHWNGTYWGVGGDYLYTFTNNAYGQILMHDWYIFALGSWQQYMQYRYYYEEYEGPAGIPDPQPLRATIAPDPFTDAFIVSFEAGAGGAATLKLYDAAGCLLTRTETMITPGANNITCSGGYALPAGVYIYELSTGGATCRGRVVRQ